MMGMYRDCAFLDCKQAAVKALDFPLCADHCQIVYLDVKGLLDNIDVSTRIRAATAASAVNDTKPRVLRSKVLGTVYFARMGDLIKIGYSTNVTQRMRDLGGAELLATVPGTMGTERAFHARFGPLWERGELFRPGEELMDYIDTIKPSSNT